ncbi:MAG: LUD domain-containing protein [Deltaproteobacteria bacterium]|nr:LUD domain-containing protein [Deltaproteobacteria bacterium]
MSDLVRRVAEAARDRTLGKAVLKACDHAVRERAETLSTFDDYPVARQAVHDARAFSLANLDELLATLTSRLEERGIHVFRAHDSEQAHRYVTDLAEKRGLTTVVKSKSMTGEEAGLAPALEKAGCRVVETDLGEYIVQLRKEPPSHLIAPALHLSRRQIGDLFADSLGMKPTHDPTALCAFARKRLRKEFLQADLGIVGVNLAVANTGDLITVTNEGNGRLCESLPSVVVAFTGVEKVVSTPEHAAAVLRILSKNATGQIATTYTSFLRAPADPSEPIGPTEIHLVLMDNGRSRMEKDPVLAEGLLCIRCGACLNCCPVYRSIGGHAYGTTYVGPMGIVFSEGLLGPESPRDLTMACTMCGECGRVCPAMIDLPEIIEKLRQRSRKPLGRRLALTAGGAALARPSGLRLSGGMVGALGRMAPVLFGKVSRLAGWTGPLPPPVPADRSFRKQWKDWRPRQGTALASGSKVSEPPAPVSPTARGPDSLTRFVKNFEKVHGELIRGRWSDGLRSVLETLDKPMISAGLNVREHLPEATGEVLDPLDPDLTRDRAGQAVVGVTRCQAMVAETGSILLGHGPGHERVASLLPDVHVVLARVDQLVDSYEQALVLRDRLDTPAATLITGPSRTADIEKLLILGMHGPRRLVLVVTN